MGFVMALFKWSSWLLSWTFRGGDNSHVGCVLEVDKKGDKGDKVEVQGVTKWRFKGWQSGSGVMRN